MNEQIKTDEEYFQEFAQLIRDTVRWIDSVPMAEKDQPLINLGEGLKAALRQYDSNQGP